VTYTWWQSTQPCHSSRSLCIFTTKSPFYWDYVKRKTLSPLQFRYNLKEIFFRARKKLFFIEYRLFSLKDLHLFTHTWEGDGDRRFTFSGPVSSLLMTFSLLVSNIETDPPPPPSPSISIMKEIDRGTGKPAHIENRLFCAWKRFTLHTARGVRGSPLQYWNVKTPPPPPPSPSISDTNDRARHRKACFLYRIQACAWKDSPLHTHARGG
jgi:hypothetical protein